MDSIRLINYRNFEDTQEVNIKPLTFLLGANSSGKSSFLKIFPLIKQSVNNSVRGSFLWNGPLVDFEDFQNVVRNGEGDITMSFCLRDLRIRHQRLWPSSQKIPSLKVCFSLSKKDERLDYLSNLKIVAHNVCIDINFKTNSREGESVDSITINGSDFSNEYNNIKAINYIGIIPRLIYKNKDEMYDAPEKVLSKIKKLLNLQASRDDDGLMRFKITRFLTELPYHIISNDDIYNIINKEFKHSFSSDKEKIQDIINTTLYYNINNFIDTINEYFSRIAKNITYVAPLRANFERYYRFQNYSVDAIDADGRNLAMFLNSLGDNNMSDFNQWLSQVFKFEIKLSPSVGHVAIELKEQGKDYRNLVDLGFGYTEMLPILAMIWKDVEYEKKDRYHQHIFAIEQPELHLHPRFQAKFAQLLVNVINVSKRKNYDVRFIIETHSDIIINKIGQLIDRKKFDNKDVNVILFNAQNEGMNNYVESTNYSEDGYIINWPYSFFEEEEDYVD